MFKQTSLTLPVKNCNFVNVYSKLNKWINKVFVFITATFLSVVLFYFICATKGLCSLCEFNVNFALSHLHQGLPNLAVTELVSICLNWAETEVFWGYSPNCFPSEFNNNDLELNKSPS